MPKRRAPPATRELRDPRALRAVAHPFRLTLLDLLERHRTLTSAQASSLTGESTASCSFHLRQLAKYGFVARAEAANGKERPWRRSARGERVPDSPDPALGRAGAEVGKLLVDRLANEAFAWLERRTGLTPEWRGGVLDHELLYLTPDELEELSRAVVELFAGYGKRDGGATGSQPVRAAALVFPLETEAS